MPKLPNDVVFQLMLSDLGNEGLDTLKNLSQVSQAWRKVGMSPVLWARLLNFEELRLKKDAWRTEVLRRTGDCALHVNGNWIPSVIQEFFLHDFLVPNMHRIKTLHAHVGLMTKKIDADPAWSVVFDKPAPVLEVFGLDFNTRHEQQDPPPVIRQALRDGKQLFAGHAPALRAFDCDPYFALNPGAGILSASTINNLTTLVLSQQPESVLAILSTTPQLKRLFLVKKTWTKPLEVPEITSVSLPALEFIGKQRDYHDSFFHEIFKAIVAPPGISIFGYFDEEHANQVAPIFLEYMEKTKPARVVLHLTRFRISDHFFAPRAAADDIFCDPSRKEFSISIWRDEEIAAFLRALVAADPDFSSVREWQIRRYSDSTYQSCSRDVKNALKSFFEKFLLPGQVLSVDKHNHKHLMSDKVFAEDQVVQLVENEPGDHYRDY